jgi:hypothetical protein
VARVTIEANEVEGYDVVDILTKEKLNDEPLILSSAQSLARKTNDTPRPKTIGGEPE